MKTDNNILNVNPLNNYNRDEDEVVGNLDIRIKLTLCDLPEGITETYSEAAVSIFNGLGWETEIAWMVAQLMKKKFGRPEEDICAPFEEVIKNL